MSDEFEKGIRSMRQAQNEFAEWRRIWEEHSAAWSDAERERWSDLLDEVSQELDRALRPVWINHDGP
ncbi:MAG: hypothetical protein ACE5MI_12460 [Acidimicrobiia bacterium]